MISYVLGVVTGLLVIPAALGVMAGLGWFREGWWTRLDEGCCGACPGVPHAQWSPFHVCPRCGRRQVRSYLRRVVGGERLQRWMKHGQRDEAWLNGEPDRASS